jgi:hypothetical protein
MGFYIELPVEGRKLRKTQSLLVCGVLRHRVSRDDDERSDEFVRRLPRQFSAANDMAV